jgi:hypothetical protein
MYVPAGRGAPNITDRPCQSAIGAEAVTISVGIGVGVDHGAGPAVIGLA